MTDPVDWELAARVATRVARRDPFADVTASPSLQDDFDRHTAEAEGIVGDLTGLHSLAGPARSRVVDRAQWVEANLVAFQRLLRPLTDKFRDRLGSGGLAPLARRVAGVEVGALLGWMSSRVLGQYDLLIVEEENPHDQDLVYYVGPNVVALERRFGFPAEQFRLWLAVHEVTHRAQFTGVPWLRPHFLGLVEQALDAVDPDPGRFLAAARRALEARNNGGLEDGGLLGVFATPEQKAVLDRISGLMSLLEGHGDVTMERAAEGRIPAAARFGRVLRERRRSASGVARLVQRLVGLEAKLAQYEQGERFIAAVDAAGGQALFDQVWTGPEQLPDLAEIRDPGRWITRVRATAGVGA